MFSVYDGELHVVMQYDHVMCASRGVCNVTGGRFSEVLCRKPILICLGTAHFRGCACANMEMRGEYRSKCKSKHCLLCGWAAGLSNVIVPHQVHFDRSRHSYSCIV